MMYNFFIVIGVLLISVSLAFLMHVDGFSVESVKFVFGLLTGILVLYLVAKKISSENELLATINKLRKENDLLKRDIDFLMEN